MASAAAPSEDLLEQAALIFGDRAKALDWFNRPATGLNRCRPIDFMGTTEGREIVRDFLVRIEFGVYS